MDLYGYTEKLLRVNSENEPDIKEQSLMATSNNTIPLFIWG
jgi:hypothetical protein